LFPFIHIFRLKFSPTKIKKRWEIPLLSPPKFGNHFKKPNNEPPPKSLRQTFGGAAQNYYIRKKKEGAGF
jgi:hypothetical protein